MIFVPHTAHHIVDAIARCGKGKGCHADPLFDRFVSLSHLRVQLHWLHVYRLTVFDLRQRHMSPSMVSDLVTLRREFLQMWPTHATQISRLFLVFILLRFRREAGNDKEGCLNAVAVQQRHGHFVLITQTVIKGDGNSCRAVPFELSNMDRVRVS